jgi:hypothetical protein
MKKITYDDTRDCAIRIVDEFIRLGLIQENEDNEFDYQDLIHHTYNNLLGLDIDDNFEIEIQ